jgi:hypothetical protein
MRRSETQNRRSAWGCSSVGRAPALQFSGLMRCAHLPKRRIVDSEDRLVRCSYVPLYWGRLHHRRDRVIVILFLASLCVWPILASGIAAAWRTDLGNGLRASSLSGIFAGWVLAGRARPGQFTVGGRDRGCPLGAVIDPAIRHASGTAGRQAGRSSALQATTDPTVMAVAAAERADLNTPAGPARWSIRGHGPDTSNFVITEPRPPSTEWDWDCTRPMAISIWRLLVHLVATPSENR